MEHTQEPWAVGEESFDNEGFTESVIRALDDRAAVAVTLDFGPNNPGMREANARRIVACVNACAGISTESMEAGGLGSLLSLGLEEQRRADEAEKQRDELLAALEALRDIGALEPGLIGSGGGIEEAQELARTAIANAKAAGEQK